MTCASFQRRALPPENHRGDGYIHVLIETPVLPGPAYGLSPAALCGRRMQRHLTAAIKTALVIPGWLFYAG